MKHPFKSLGLTIFKSIVSHTKMMMKIVRDNDSLNGEGESANKYMKEFYSGGELLELEWIVDDD